MLSVSSVADCLSHQVYARGEDRELRALTSSNGYNFTRGILQL